MTRHFLWRSLPGGSLWPGVLKILSLFLARPEGDHRETGPGPDRHSNLTLAGKHGVNILGFMHFRMAFLGGLDFDPKSSISAQEALRQHGTK